jgi:hypothetical protein
MIVPISEKDLARAIVFAINTWQRTGYGLPFPKGRVISATWFKDFLGRWSVARTIRADKQDVLRHLLNERIVSVAWSENPAHAVVQLSKEVARRRITAQSRNGKRMIPISLVSKVAFFYRPARLAPYDSYARKGLSMRVGSEVISGDYESFVTAFNNEFRKVHRQIEKECHARWARELSGKMGMPLSNLSRTAFRRKVFDNVLMAEAGRFS